LIFFGPFKSLKIGFAGYNAEQSLIPGRPGTNFTEFTFCFVGIEAERAGFNIFFQIRN